MRTTVDIDPKLLERLRQEAVRQKMSFRELLNAVLRRGLEAPRQSKATEYTLPTFHMGAVREDVNLDKALAVASSLDSAEVVSKIERRK